MIYVIIAIAAGLLALDQFMKISARKGTLPAPIFKDKVVFQHIENDGLTFSILRNHPKLTHIIPFACFSTLVPSLLVQWKKGEHLHHLGVLLVIAGACSNLWDRIRRGTVTDMIRFYRLPGKLKNLCWNVADFMLIAGSILLVLSSFLHFLKRDK